MARKVRYETTAKDEWDNRTSDLDISIEHDMPFAEIFEAYLPKSTQMSIIEVGSIPGNFLVYFHKAFGYKVNGIDFAENTRVFHETMKCNGIKDYNFNKADFFNHSIKEKFDVVVSFGFIEHFDDTKDVVSRHVELMKPGGYLVLTVPNFRFLQYFYHLHFDKPNLDIHNLNAMKIGKLKSILKNQGMQKLYARYYGNLKVWRQNTPLSQNALKRVNALHRWVGDKGHKFPTSRLYSPYIVLIYRKPDDK
jgi:2-polyprenyl-3-methyl-5-hydroxy-6-metoxy-1,4-benzoquinol methylase